MYIEVSQKYVLFFLLYECEEKKDRWCVVCVKQTIWKLRVDVVNLYVQIFCMKIQNTQIR